MPWVREIVDIWRDALDEEFEALKETGTVGTFSFIEIPPPEFPTLHQLFSIQNE